MTKILDLAAHPQFAELLELVEVGDAVILERDGEQLAQFQLVGIGGKSGGWVFGLGEKAISYVADDFDAELPESFWMGEE